jgi:hypothetical protein
MFKILLLSLSFILYSCEEQVIEKIEEQKVGSLVGTTFSGSCNPLSVQNIVCTNEVQNALVAYKNLACNSTGNSQTLSECSVESCKAGHILQNNSCSALLNGCQEGYNQVGELCRKQACKPNERVSFSCTNEIENSATASIIRSCNFEGTVARDSSCILNSCRSGYVAQNGKCKKQICVAGVTTNENCTPTIAYASSAKRNVNCSADGTTKTSSSCLLIDCKSGYKKIGNLCAPELCTPNSRTQAICTSTINNSLKATKVQICNSNGIGATYGNCMLQTCDSGYYKSGNSCIKQSCTPGSRTEISCVNNIENAAIAKYVKSCNTNGNSETQSSCNLVKCNTGYFKRGNACIKQICTPSEASEVNCTQNIENASGAKIIKTCNGSGRGHTSSTCNLTSCKSGYFKSGNKCLSQTCTPNAVKKDLDCSKNISNASEATYTRSCNSSGNLESNSACTLLKCNSGYNKVGSSCIKQMCTPGSKREVACAIDVKNASTASSTLLCNSMGNGETGSNGGAPTCELKTCIDGYKVEAGNCVLAIQKICEPGQREVSCKGEIVNSSLASKVYSCNDTGTVETPGICIPSACIDGYTLNKITNTCDEKEQEEEPETTNTIKLNNTWLNLGQQETRALVGLHSGSSRLWADENQSCKDWLQGQGVDYEQVGTSVDYKDGDRMHYNGEKGRGAFNAIPEHYQNYRSARFTTNQCPYRFKLSKGKVVCEYANISDSFKTVSDRIKARYSIKTAVDIRAVAACNATSNSVHSMGRRAFTMELLVRMKKAPTKQNIILDDRFLTSISQQNEIRGKKNESALEYISRLSIPIRGIQNLYTKKTYSDLSHLFQFRSNSPLSISQWSDKTNRSIVGLCPYEISSMNETSPPTCDVLACSTKGVNKRPVLKCISHYTDILSNNETESRYELGLVDTELNLDPGFTLNTPENGYLVGIKTRNGPDGISTAQWMKQLGVKYESLNTFKEFLNSYYTHEIVDEINWYKRGSNIPYPINYHHADVITENSCPYELVTKSGDLEHCLKLSCTETPIITSRFDGNPTPATHNIRPVRSCIEESNWKDQSYKRGFFKHSIHIYN